MPINSSRVSYFQFNGNNIHFCSGISVHGATLILKLLSFVPLLRPIIENDDNNDDAGDDAPAMIAFSISFETVKQLPDTCCWICCVFMLYDQRCRGLSAHVTMRATVEFLIRFNSSAASKQTPSLVIICNVERWCVFVYAMKQRYKIYN